MCWVFFLNHKFSGQRCPSPLGIWWGSPMPHTLPPYQMRCSFVPILVYSLEDEQKILCQFLLAAIKDVPSALCYHQPCSL